MRLLLDQGLPRTTAPVLRDHGLDAIHAGEVGLAAAADEWIIEHARANGYCIVTLDADFHALIAGSGATKPSVIRLRLERLKARDAAGIILAVIERAGEAVDSGCFVTVTRDSIRLRRLPVGSGV